MLSHLMRGSLAYCLASQRWELRPAPQRLAAVVASRRTACPSWQWTSRACVAMTRWVHTCKCMRRCTCASLHPIVCVRLMKCEFELWRLLGHLAEPHGLHTRMGVLQLAYPSCRVRTTMCKSTMAVPVHALLPHSQTRLLGQAQTACFKQQ